MKTWQVIASLAVTALLLFIADLTSARRSSPKRITAENEPYRLIHTAQYVHEGSDTSPLFEVRFDGPKAPGNVTLTLMYAPLTEEQIRMGRSVSFIPLRMMLAEHSLDIYEVFVPPYPRGSEIRYYIKAEDLDGEILATLPENASDTTNTLPFRFEGIAPAWLILLRVAFTIGAVLTATLAFFTSLNILKGRDAINLLGKQVMWATIFLLFGQAIFATMYDRRVTGPPGWGGWPFGQFNLHDTMIEIALLSWLFPTVVMAGSAIARRETANLVMPETAGKFTIVAYFILAAAIVIY